MLIFGPIEQVLIYASIPTAAVVIGSLVASVREPGPRLRSMIQHFAAGVVFSAVAVELVPGLIRDRELSPLVVGFSLGVGAMLGLRWVIARLEQTNEPKGRTPTGLVGAVGIDMFVDGLLVGVSIVAGARQGVLVTIALTIDLLFLGLSTTSSLLAAHRTRGGR